MSQVFFINPPSPQQTVYMKELGRCGRKSVAGELWPQTGLAYLAAVSRKAGYDANVLDAMAEGMTPQQALEHIQSFQPDLCVLHTTTPTFSFDRLFAAQLKEQLPQTLLAMTGTHVSALPRETLEGSDTDIAIVGEAEDTITEILDALRNGKPPQDSAIPGTWTKKNGSIINHESRPPRDPLDSLPFPARDLLPNERYHMPFFGDEPFVTVISSRGCPYQCIFCRAGLTWGERTRHRSPDNVLEELRTVRDTLGIRNVVFMTDLFTIRKPWVLEICNRMVEENLGIRWICNSRADSVDPDMLRLMKKAGCQLISYGLESGDQEILDRTRKCLQLEHGRNAIAWTRDAGILAFGYFIIGLPGETWDTIQKTIDYAIKVEPDYALFHIATPFPGTELYSWAQQNGFLQTHDWSDFDEETGVCMRTEHLSAEDLLQAKKMATRRFYLRPGRLWKEVSSVRSLKEFALKARAGLKVLGRK